MRLSEIDAYYLQRLISNAFSVSSTAATTEEEKENDQTKMSEIAEKALQARWKRQMTDRAKMNSFDFSSTTNSIWSER